MAFCPTSHEIALAINTFNPNNIVKELKSGTLEIYGVHGRVLALLLAPYSLQTLHHRRVPHDVIAELWFRNLHRLGLVRRSVATYFGTAIASATYINLRSNRVTDEISACIRRPKGLFFKKPEISEFLIGRANYAKANKA